MFKTLKVVIQRIKNTLKSQIFLKDRDVLSVQNDCYCYYVYVSAVSASRYRGNLLMCVCV